MFLLLSLSCLFANMLYFQKRKKIFLRTPWYTEFLDQGSDLRHSCDPGHGCHNAGSLTHGVGLGLEHACQHSRDTLIPLCHSNVASIPLWEPL